MKLLRWFIRRTLASYKIEIMKELDLTRKQVQKDMKELQEMHIIAREGTNRRGRWIIVKENK